MVIQGFAFIRHGALVRVILLAALFMVLGLVLAPGKAHATSRTFTSGSAALGSQGYVLTADTGETYAFGVPHRGNPGGFGGRIVGTAVASDGGGYVSISSAGQVYAYGTVVYRGNPTGFSGEIEDIAVTADGRGYIAVSSTGQIYTYGTAVYRGNPAGFSGKIVAVAVTADGQGYTAISSTGQLYAYGTARGWPNPTNFSGQFTDVQVTFDGLGTVAITSTGQLYAYGTARSWPNPTGYTGNMVSVSLSWDGQGLIAVSSSGQVYAYGTIAHRGNGDPGVADNAVDVHYRNLGGSTSDLGPRTSGYMYLKDSGIGQHYAAGSIYWSPNTGAHRVYPQIRDKWAAKGWEAGFLGYPTSDPIFVKDNGIGQHFQGGSIYWSPNSGAAEIHGSIRDKYAQLGWERSALGFPKTDENPAGRNSRYNSFQNGGIYWSSLTGTHAVQGAIYSKWASLGWENGYLGLPISDEVQGYNNQLLASHFVGGDIYFNNINGAYTASDTLPWNVMDPIHTQDSPTAFPRPGHLEYDFDLPLDTTGYLNIPAKPELAFRELRRDFNDNFPVWGAPDAFPAQGQNLPLDACFYINKVILVANYLCKAPVTSYSNGTTFIRYTSLPGHFDGENATITFTFVDSGGQLHLNVTAYVVNTVLPESVSREGARIMWETFAYRLGRNIWLHDCYNGC